MRNEMDGQGSPIRLNKELIQAVERMHQEHDLKIEGYHISFHPTDGGPTIGKGVFIKKTGLNTGDISGVFIPTAKSDNQNPME